MPTEIMLEVLSYLSPNDLARASQTCRCFAHYAYDDRLWADLVNDNLPVPIKDPGLFPSFRRLYSAHSPFWFIPKYKIWFADNEHTGNLILARYDNRRGVIEAYRIIADRGRPMLRLWAHNPEVMIQTFDPQVLLWLDDPVLFLKDHDPKSQVCTSEAWAEERPMPMHSDSNLVHSTLNLCRQVPAGVSHPDELWPPVTIPTQSRVARRRRHQQSFPGPSSKIVDFAFAIRRWPMAAFVSVALHDEIFVTYATLDPGLYTATEDKPYQGIWVGDYNAHGCEFILFIQQGTSLTAIKLTGDPNVPRGELTFKADEIGPDSTIRIAREEPFEGARVVPCLGHVAGLGFHDDTFISSQLFLISKDEVAHYWQDLGHISYFRRVDIDGVLRT
ncbi:hypothetical protein N7470_001015 [Penicillium chermesinum]|nr:hypothetical protein N7470_001015 [Penicillium chermesinum]